MPIAVNLGGTQRGGADAVSWNPSVLPAASYGPICAGRVRDVQDRSFQ